MNRSNKKATFFANRVEIAYHLLGYYVIDDEVKVLYSLPRRIGRIIRLIHSNHGKGRVYADVADEHGNVTREPLGRLRKVRKGQQ